MTYTKLDPQTVSDFSMLIAPNDFPTLDPGHMCVSVPNAPSSTRAGSNATLQIMYVAGFDTPGNNDTFYACADIKFVPADQFTIRIPCFNATEENSIEDVDGPSGHDSAEEERHKKALSGGAIAGIVVGVVAFVVFLLAAAGLWYRERKQKNRLRRQQASLRGVKWNEAEAVKDSASQSGIGMQNLS